MAGTTASLTGGDSVVGAVVDAAGEVVGGGEAARSMSSSGCSTTTKTGALRSPTDPLQADARQSTAPITDAEARNCILLVSAESSVAVFASRWDSQRLAGLASSFDGERLEYDCDSTFADELPFEHRRGSVG